MFNFKKELIYRYFKYYKPYCNNCGNLKRIKIFNILFYKCKLYKSNKFRSFLNNYDKQCNTYYAKYKLSDVKQIEDEMNKRIFFIN